MTKDKALKLALDTFERMNHEDSIFAGEFDKEIIAIKEALVEAAARADEREAAAKEAEAQGCHMVAAAIRARGTT